MRRTFQFSVPSGRSTLSFTVPSWISCTEVVSNSLPLNAFDPDRDIPARLKLPLGTPQLRELASRDNRVAVCVTDATRDCPDHLLLPPMLQELEQAGIAPDQVTIIVAVGTHRPSTRQEKLEKLGAEIVDRYAVLDHDAYDNDALAEVGVDVGGRPALVNRIVSESDLVIATGRVEPHQYAGYSGGGKTVAVGCGSEAFIAYSHGPAMLDHDGTRLGVIDGNPFQEAVREIAAAVPVDFVANCVLDDHGQLVDVAFGHPSVVHDRLVETAADLYTVEIQDQVDLVVAGVGYPKDQNLYQTSRAASYLQFAPTPVVREGGLILLPAACPEGAGEGFGEQRFAAAMNDPEAFRMRISAGQFLPGEQRAYIMQKVLQDVQVVVVGADKPADIEAVGIRTVPSLEDAWHLARSLFPGDATGLIIPHALLTLPVVA